MIHNLTTTIIAAIPGKQGLGVGLHFDIITEVGKAHCRVATGVSLDKDGRAKLYVESYEVLGVKCKIESTLVMMEGIKRILSSIRQLCDDNNWNCWSY